MSERFEERDGKVYKVVTVPEVKPRRRRRNLVRVQRLQSVGAGKAIAKRIRRGKKLLAYCGECQRTWKEPRLLDREFPGRVEREP
jgi:hypothetical protein